MEYSRVIEKLSDGSKTVYSFVSHDQVQDEPSSGAFTLGMNNDMYNKFSSRKLDRGLLRSADFYNASQKLIKKEAYTYHSDLSDYLKTIERYALMNTLLYESVPTRYTPISLSCKRKKRFSIPIMAI